MRKRITFEEAARLDNTIQAPARLPYHADVNGNPVYQQFMRLTHIYEEEELAKRQDDMQSLLTRYAMMHHEQGQLPHLPGPQFFSLAGQGLVPTPRGFNIGTQYRDGTGTQAPGIDFEGQVPEPDPAPTTPVDMDMTA